MRASGVSQRRGLWLACVLAALATLFSGGLGVEVRAAGVGAAAVDEPQYLLSALSLFEDGDLNIADERESFAYEPFHQQAMPIQTEVLDDGRRISPHDPLLPLLLAIPMGLGGFVAAKWTLVVMAAALAALTTYAAVTRFAVPARLAGVVAGVAGSTPPLSVYAHQVYPELPAAVAVTLCVLAIVPPQGHTTRAWTVGRVALFVAAVSALPWLAAKYMLVAAALAVVGLAHMWRASKRAALWTSGAFVASGVGWIVGHWLIYGGWTSYATGDHFTARGEFSAIGFAPDYLGRSVRLVGLFTDETFGLLAWQPAWLLAVFAVGFVGFRYGGVFAAPIAAGWITATFIALTMHGYWWPGRQVVVILPLLVLACAIALHRAPTWRVSIYVATAVAALVGFAYQAWLLIAGRSGALAWVLAPDDTPPTPLNFLREALPNYRVLLATDWALHTTWAAACLALLIIGMRSAPTNFIKLPTSPHNTTQSPPRHDAHQEVS